ncbi:uncharacterized protein [Elaeis guineensis]|uniref:RING-type E3 ubiquitin transferase n=1 Tax=Elaeis guineensis var. tenera TaxID=51953 RepID=A0A6I9RAX8_ELAGV|nr:E3 ubiquitin-protein ligase Praja-1 [Elaeis guineensis]XP_010922809.1 E3 ubiquitin-protein ligase Praja-1 [Elaeis guineensis]XP_010922810.1 E3 ubiquitin-protein ligase Praja-1 [Elaeis guineensis]XP_010922812.1 E3 ubiquitin-protein ligase Praja-1 [Elaeis guineensis]
MDAESQHLSHEPMLSLEHAQLSSNSFRHSSQQEAHCLVCRRAFSLEAEVNEGFEAISICRECKIMVLEDNEGNITLRDIRRRRRQRGRSRFGNSESMEDSFSQQFSHLINLASQNHESLFEGDTSVTVRQHARYYAARSRSRRRHRALSDNDSDGLDHVDSMFGESDSNLSFGGYGGDSDASLDRNSLLDREIFFPPDSESYVFTDTDIDPMHAGLDQWNSDDQDEEDGEWEDADFDENNAFVDQHQQFQDANSSPSGIGESERGAQDGAWVNWRMGASQQVHYVDIFADLESDLRPPYVGNPGDYLDARGFEELLEQLAENDGSRRGAPPAAASFVASLPSVIISMDHERNGSLICAVCKDPLPINTEAKQLPCKHLYHPSCILPWLAARNSCPVCRYELPTDDPEYEGKRSMMSRNEVHDTQQPDPAEESSYEVLSEMETDEGHEPNHGRVQQGGSEDTAQIGDGSSRESSRGGWLFLAAAPIVSIVGMVLVLWFRNPRSEGRIHCNTREPDSQQLHRSLSTRAAADRNRRWWSIF